MFTLMSCEKHIKNFSFFSKLLLFRFKKTIKKVKLKIGDISKKLYASLNSSNYLNESFEYNSRNL